MSLFDLLTKTIQSNPYYKIKGNEVGLTHLAIDKIVLLSQKVNTELEQIQIRLKEDHVLASTEVMYVMIDLVIKPLQFRMRGNLIEFEFELGNSSLEKIPDKLLSFIILFFLKLLNKDFLIDKALTSKGSIQKVNEKTFVYTVQIDNPTKDDLVLDLAVQENYLWINFQKMKPLDFILKHLSKLV